MKLNLKIASLLSLMAATGVATAQITLNRASKGTEDLPLVQWESTIQSAATMGDTGDSERLASAYNQAVGNKQLTQAAAKVAFGWDTRAKPFDTSLMALQVLQNQKMIEQNEQIIKLLSKQQKSK